MISIEPAVYPFLALLILTIPLKWIIAALVAGLLHEFSHILIILLLGGKICTVCIGIGGARIEAGINGNIPSFFSILAGPVCSLLLFLLHRFFPRLALCALVQGIFNLVPVYPLDGGKLLNIVLNTCLPQYANSIQKRIEACFSLGFAVVSAVAWRNSGFGILPLAILCGFLMKVFLRKKPCKQGPNRIQ